MIEIDVEIKSKKWLSERGIEKKIKKICQNIVPLTDLNKILTPDFHLEIALSLVSNQQIKKINQQFRQKDKPTDVLSFAQIDENKIRQLGIRKIIGKNKHLFLGDIVISYEYCVKDAIKQNKNFFHHLTHLITHSILHLLGHDHENEEMSRIMEEKEIKILKKLHIENPYL